MLRVSQDAIDCCDCDYPGLAETVEALERRPLPSCPRCGSEDTAEVHVGIVGRTIYLAAISTRFKLIANGPKQGEFWCGGCGRWFGR